jgi:single-strand DNA-binding protein
MAGSVNKVIIVGNVGNQPEIRVTQASGEELATFSLATSERWKDKSTGEQKEKTDWHKVVVFAPGLVRVIKEYVHKGSKLYIEGEITNKRVSG